MVYKPGEFLRNEIADTVTNSYYGKVLKSVEGLIALLERRKCIY